MPSSADIALARATPPPLPEGEGARQKAIAAFQAEAAAISAAGLAVERRVVMRMFATDEIIGKLRAIGSAYERRCAALRDMRVPRLAIEARALLAKEGFVITDEEFRSAYEERLEPKLILDVEAKLVPRFKMSLQEAADPIFYRHCALALAGLKSMVPTATKEHLQLAEQLGLPAAVATPPLARAVRFAVKDLEELATHQMDLANADSLVKLGQYLPDGL